MLILYMRTFIIYFSLLAAVRLMGKRQIGELQISEFTITLLLSEIAAAPLTDPSLPLLHTFLPLLLLLSLERLVSHILLKSRFLRRLICGTPTVLISRGHLLQKEMRKNRIELDELLAELRQHGIRSLEEVHYAILEENGKLSVLCRAADQPCTPRDLSRKVPETGLAHPLVLDGYILRENLQRISWTEEQLRAELHRMDIPLADVFLLTVDDRNHPYLIRKEFL